MLSLLGLRKGKGNANTSFVPTFSSIIHCYISTKLVLLETHVSPSTSKCICMKVPSTSILGRMVRKCLLSNYEWFSVPVFIVRGFSGGSVGKESTCNAGDLGLISGFGRSPREGNGSPLKYSCLRNPINRGAWWAKFHGLPIVGCNLVTKPHRHL